MKFKALLVDDNLFMASVLSDLLKENHPYIDVLDIAKNGKEGIEKIKQLKPDLVFLDIEMPDMTGFEMLSKLNVVNFQTIFITAHSQYALKAFRFNALDYLLKPIDEKELSQAIKRHTSLSKLQSNQNKLNQALINFQTQDLGNQYLQLQTQKGTLQLALKQLVMIEGERNYSLIHLSDNTKVLSAKTLGYFEDILSEKGFFRCHRSFLLNRNHIDDMGKNTFILKDLTEIPISRRKKIESNKWYSTTQ